VAIRFTRECAPDNGGMQQGPCMQLHVLMA
jgi:hypothetical protein